MPGVDTHSLRGLGRAVRRRTDGLLGAAFLFCTGAAAVIPFEPPAPAGCLPGLPAAVPAGAFCVYLSLISFSLELLSGASLSGWAGNLPWRSSLSHLGNFCSGVNFVHFLPALLLPPAAAAAILPFWRGCTAILPFWAGRRNISLGFAAALACQRAFCLPFFCHSIFILFSILTVGHSFVQAFCGLRWYILFSICRLLTGD